jgi:hypothetical protein
MTDRLAPSERHKYTYEGRTVYAWEQTFCEVNVYVEVPPGARAKDLLVTIGTKHIKFGLGSNTPYLDVSVHLAASSFGIAHDEQADNVQRDLTRAVKTSESFWTLGTYGGGSQRAAHTDPRSSLQRMALCI